MTLSEGLYSHIAGLIAEARVYAAAAPTPAEGEEYLDVVVLQFNGAVFTTMDEPRMRDATYIITAISRNHLNAVETAERIADNLHGFSGVMGGGVTVVDIQAEELPEDFDAEHKLFGRSISWLIRYEF